MLTVRDVLEALSRRDPDEPVCVQDPDMDRSPRLTNLIEETVRLFPDGTRVRVVVIRPRTS